MKSDTPEVEGFGIWKTNKIFHWTNSGNEISKHSLCPAVSTPSYKPTPLASELHVIWQPCQSGCCKLDDLTYSLFSPGREPHHGAVNINQF